MLLALLGVDVLRLGSLTPGHRRRIIAVVVLFFIVIKVAKVILILIILPFESFPSEVVNRTWDDLAQVSA